MASPVRSALLAAVALVAILSLASVAFSKPTWEQLDNYHFDQYVHDFARVYRDADEKHMRRALFERALDTIRSHNRRNLSWKMGVNHFTDRTDEEKRVVLGYRQDIGYLRRGDGRIAQELVAGDHTLLANLPTSVDWRKAGIVSPVKDQGHCGSCWSFAAASTLESFYALITGQLPTLSEQQILSCTPNPDECGGTGGCAGGTAELAFSTLLEHGSGIASEWVYPYMSYRGSNYKCHFSPIRTPIAANISGVVKLPANQYSPLMNAVATLGPISISVDASAWHSYESGVFTGCNATSIDINHAVVLVGYGTDAQFGDYWLVRNSWSPTWGEQGYVRIARSSTPKCGIDSTPADGTGCKGGPTSVYCCGECGILYDSSYPIVFPSS